MRLTDLTHNTSKFAVMLTLAAMIAITGCAKKKSLPDNASQLGIGANAAKPGTSQDFTVNVGDRVFFTTDSSTLTAEARQILDRQSVWLNKYNSYGITIEGHADERGTREYNIALSARRAEAAKNFLIAQGVAPGRISTIAFGKERPLALCSEESCFAQNRRSVTVITGGAVAG